jgi:hypothetical protein
MRDIDLLIRAGDSSRAVAVLRSLGFETIDPRLDDGRVLVAEHHLTPMVRPGFAGSVELHTEILPPRWRRTLATEDVWAGATRTGSVLVMDDVHAVTHGLLHALGSDAAHRARTLPIRALVDVAGRLRQTDLGPVDWSAVRARFVTSGDASFFDGFTAVAHRVGLPTFDTIPSYPRRSRTHACLVIALAGTPKLATALNTTVRRIEMLDKAVVERRTGDSGRRHRNWARAQLGVDWLRRRLARAHANWPRMGADVANNDRARARSRSER